MDTAWATVVQLWECNFVLSAYVVADYNFVDIVEFVPIFIFFLLLTVKRLKLRTSRNR